MSTDYSYFPIIDVAALNGGNAAQVAAIGHEVRQAFTGSGFCYIRNHGVDQAIIDRAARAAMAFFRRPLEEKLKSAPTQSVRGFNAIGRTKMYGADNPDYKEYYQIGLDLAPDHPLVLAGQPLRGPTAGLMTILNSKRP